MCCPKMPVWVKAMFTLYVFIVMISASNSFAGDKPTMKVYHISFHAETYAPISLQSLLSNPIYKIYFYQHHPFVNELNDIFINSKTGSHDVDLTDLRLIVKMGEDDIAVYAFNRDGTGKEMNTGKTFKLKDNDKIFIDEKIENYHRVVDQLPLRDVWGTD